MKIAVNILVIVTMLAGFAPTQKIGLFERSVDIGNPKLTGSAQFDRKTGTYTLKGSGYDIWYAHDEFHYLFRRMTGDFTATAEFEFIGKGVEPHRKIGWMVRESLADSAAHLSAAVHGDGLTVFQWRVANGATMRTPQDEISSPEKATQTLELTRTGNTYTMRVAKKGGEFQVVGTHEMTTFPAKSVLVGLFICSHNPATVEEATVRNVHIVRGSGRKL